MDTQMYEKTIKDLYSRHNYPYGGQQLGEQQAARKKCEQQFQSTLERLQRGEIDDPAEDRPYNLDDVDDIVIATVLKPRWKAKVKKWAICLVVVGFFVAATVVHIGGKGQGGAVVDDVVVSSMAAKACGEDQLATKEGFEACAGLCQESACCRDADPNQNCRSGKADFCDDRSPCDILLHPGDGAYQPFPNAPVNLMETCNGQYPSDAASSSSLADGLAECEASCFSASCCFSSPPDGDSNCYSTYTAACQEYAPCQSTMGSFPGASEEDVAVIMEETATHDHQKDEKANIVDTMPNPQGYIQSVCNPQSLGTEDGARHCRDACENRMCCVESGEHSCMDEANPEHCLPYLPCSALAWDQFGDLKDDGRSPLMDQTMMDNPPPGVDFPPPSGMGINAPDVRGACLDDNIARYGRQTCEDLCRPWSCCFVPAGEVGSCQDPLGGECDVFGDICGIVFDDGEDPNKL